MGNPNPKNKFKKGVNYNPLGAKSHNPVKRRIGKLTNAEIEDIGSLLLKGDLEELKRIATCETETVFRRWLSVIVVKAMNKGDHYALEMILNRIAGKPKERVDVSMDLNTQVIITLPSNGREVDPKPDK